MSLLQITQLEKNIGNKILFPKIDLTLQQGEAVAVQCNHEVGKELIQLIIHEKSPTNGKIFLNHVQLGSSKKIFHSFGLYLMSDQAYDRLTAQEYLRFYERLYDVSIDIDLLLQKVSLIEKKNVKIRMLSFSEKKRLHLARVILHEPDVLLMEEPDQNLDIESRMILKRIVKDYINLGKTILITTNHFESAIFLTDTVYRLNEAGLKKIDVVDDDINEKNSEELDMEFVMHSTSEREEKNIDDEGEIRKPVKFEKIPAKINEKMILFDPTEILFVESHEGVSQLHVNGEIFPCLISLNDLEKRLQPFGFFRCHRSYIVNLQRVREVITWTRNSYSLVLEDAKKSSVPLSKGKMNELKEIIGI
ncbi:ABC-2 type transport system ATP-binding protein [Fictibacillus halophilus]|uniref:ABC-2 type transport system ATP-binding protein n=1 Tax=Fictibacillus halophilus TaxID=1610490 RepID=A0ABV2LI69_9BACL|nr:LytTR family transcriptional regulator DNA-binding domain-containing protein [Fictibacillus halophilus]